MIVKDRISVTYSSLEDLLDRQKIIEDRVVNYIIDNPQVADFTRSNIRVADDKYILEVELVQD